LFIDRVHGVPKAQMGVRPLAMPTASEPHTALVRFHSMA
jgi:hypothetical protein